MTDIKLPPLPEPDTHCWDDDAVPPRDVWSHSAEQLHAYSLAVAAAMACDIHSCSYYCTRPACVAAQRDELRERLEAAAPPAPGAQPSGWIACSDQMPPADVAVLVFSEDVGYVIGYTYDGVQLRDTQGPLYPDRAWWTPLPDAPEAKGGGR